MGMPGQLPVLNGRAVEFAVRLGSGVGRRFTRRRFCTQNYFYPDLPKGYQIASSTARSALVEACGFEPKSSDDASFA